MGILDRDDEGMLNKGGWSRIYTQEVYKWEDGNSRPFIAYHYFIP